MLQQPSYNAFITGLGEGVHECAFERDNVCGYMGLRASFEVLSRSE